jgi:hypothetical protein
MLTSVKVRFGACLVDWRGNCHLSGHSFAEAEEDYHGGYAKVEMVYAA